MRGDEGVRGTCRKQAEECIFCLFIFVVFVSVVCLSVCLFVCLFCFVFSGV